MVSKMKHNAPDILYSDYTRKEIFENSKDESNLYPKNIGTDFTYKHEIVWKNVVGFLIMHILALWGYYLTFTNRILFITFVWAHTTGFIYGEGVTIGAHRLFTHKSFKATPFLRAILIALHTGAGQNNLLTWCHDHRLHHRYSDTDADPHNAKRGFFFSHIGWLMAKKHPYVTKFGRTIDISDLQNDWMVMFQKKYYFQLYMIMAIGIPVGVPVYFFGEDLWASLITCYFSRYVQSLHITWLVNSAAHLYGTRPYDQNLQPVESWFVSILTSGEGWHNYHHAFPWDYKTAEFGMPFNLTATLIRLFEKIGLTYDLKTASPEMVEKRIMRTGDGTHYLLGTDEAISSVTAIGPLHPLNPSYTTKQVLKPIVLHKGLPLYHEEEGH